MANFGSDEPPTILSYEILAMSSLWFEHSFIKYVKLSENKRT